MTEPLEKMPLVESVVQEELMVEIPKMIGVMEFVKKENDVALEEVGEVAFQDDGQKEEEKDDGNGNDEAGQNDDEEIQAAAALLPVKVEEGLLET